MKVWFIWLLQLCVAPSGLLKDTSFLASLPEPSLLLFINKWIASFSSKLALTLKTIIQYSRSCMAAYILTRVFMHYNNFNYCRNGINDLSTDQLHLLQKQLPVHSWQWLRNSFLHLQEIAAEQNAQNRQFPWTYNRKGVWTVACWGIVLASIFKTM